MQKNCPKMLPRYNEYLNLVMLIACMLPGLYLALFHLQSALILCRTYVFLWGGLKCLFVHSFICCFSVQFTWASPISVTSGECSITVVYFWQMVNFQLSEAKFAASLKCVYLQVSKSVEHWATAADSWTIYCQCRRNALSAAIYTTSRCIVSWATTQTQCCLWGSQKRVYCSGMLTLTYSVVIQVKYATVRL